MLEEGELPQSYLQAVQGQAESAIGIHVDGSPPTYAEMAKKIKISENSGSDEDPLEKSTKKGHKLQKTLREEEADRLKMQGSQATLDMSISRNTRARPPKGGPPPSISK